MGVGWLLVVGSTYSWQALFASHKAVVRPPLNLLYGSKETDWCVETPGPLSARPQRTVHREALLAARAEVDAEAQSDCRGLRRFVWGPCV